MDAAKLKNVSDWLIDGARSAASPIAMVSEFCERLVAAGLPLWRVGLFIRTLHPDILGVNYIWKPGSEVSFGTADFSFLDSPEFTRRAGPRRSPAASATSNWTACAR